MLDTVVRMSGNQDAVALAGHVCCAEVLRPTSPGGAPAEQASPTHPAQQQVVSDAPLCTSAVKGVALAGSTDRYLLEVFNSTFAQLFGMNPPFTVLPR